MLAPDARLALVLYDFDFDVELTVAVTPLSTMAEALGNARLARGDKETTYPEAHARADALLGDHIGGVDLHANVPDDPRQAGGGTLTEAARYGLAMAALGELAHAIAEASQVSANVVNTMTLTRALADDLGSSEALFDSMGPDGAVVVGSCPVPDTCGDSACSTICDIGPRTVRGDLANQLEAFVTSTANATGLGTTDISEMKAHIAKDAEPELFGDAPVPGDGPLLTLSDSDFYVNPDTGIWWSPSAGPSLGGTVESADATIASVTVTVGGTTVTANLFGGNQWAASLSSAPLAVPPATNMVKVVATDSIGNLATIEKEMRVDAGAPSGHLPGHDRHRRARRHRGLLGRAADRKPPGPVGDARRCRVPVGLQAHPSHGDHQQPHPRPLPGHRRGRRDRSGLSRLPCAQARRLDLAPGLDDARPDHANHLRRPGRRLPDARQHPGAGQLPRSPRSRRQRHRSGRKERGGDDLLRQPPARAAAEGVERARRDVGRRGRRTLIQGAKLTAFRLENNNLAPLIDVVAGVRRCGRHGV